MRKPLPKYSGEPYTIKILCTDRTDRRHNAERGYVIVGFERTAHAWDARARGAQRRAVHTDWERNASPAPKFETRLLGDEVIVKTTDRDVVLRNPKTFAQRTVSRDALADMREVVTLACPYCEPSRVPGIGGNPKPAGVVVLRYERFAAMLEELRHAGIHEIPRSALRGR